MTLVEMTVALALVAIGSTAVLLSMVYSLRLDATNRETTAASRSARRMLEQMRAEPLQDVLVLFNADEDDDPGGAATAPGDTFAVSLLEKAVNGMGLDGSIVLPLDDDGILRESADIPELGFPRDLNGDGVIDAGDRSGDLIALPVLVRVTWDGMHGDRSLSYRTVLR